MPSRRQFVQSAIATTAIGILPRRPAAPAAPAAPPRIRVAVLVEPGFPAVDATVIPSDQLGAALDGMDVTYHGARDLVGLAADRYDVFISPYGSAFPKDAWPALLAYLRAGGNWVNIGGAPCAVPVARGEAGWHAEARQTEYHRRLGVTLACAVETSAIREWRASEALPWAAPLAGHPDAATVWELYYRLSSVADTPDESGSAGPMEAAVQPLVSGLDAAGRAIAAPLVMVDRLEREFVGGRWIFATHDGTIEPATVRALVEAASLGAHRFEVRPSRACYRDRERPAVTITYRAFPREAPPLAAGCRIAVYDDRGNRLTQTDVAVSGTAAGAAASAELGASLPDPLRPGLYRVEAVLTLPAAPHELKATTGFWVWDAELLAAGLPLAAGEYGFTRGGEPYPITGTTYMASDVHRKFLIQPNPWVWDRDFAEMRRAGVNLVRTGIWTGWRVLMPRVGSLEEGALRALDAFLLTARRHDIPVIFTCFAFLPEPWGGENPYLDPKAISAQQAFVSAIASRYGRMNDLLWDLINEPSFCNKDHLWSCRPNYDRFEREAWSAWIAERYPAAADREGLELPSRDDFKPGSGADRRVLEYRLFAQATFPRWVRQMTAAIRAHGNPRQLVTVGQDEAGTNDSPNNLFLARDLDFTCVHNWWLNDALVWDGVITKAPGKMNLVEETGVMFSGRPAGIEPRWEEYARDLLERKMALSVGQAAGFVEWVWNSNCYMPSDNEAAIGLLRADGTAKPELEALRGIAAFAAEARRHLVGRRDEPVLLVVPHSNMYSAENTATEATKRAVRVMQYRCRVGMSAVSEYAVTRVMRAPRLAVLPAPRLLRREAWESLLAWAEGGSIVLVTGPVDQDDIGRPVDRLQRLGIGAGAGPLVRIPLGRGALIWSARPLELSGDDDATAALYRRALGEARIEPAFTVEGADASILVHAAVYRDATLFTLASEGDRAATLRITPALSSATLEERLAPGRAALLLVGRRDGRLLARYPAA